MISSLNETTALADVIIPPLGPLEHEHYPIVELSYAVHNAARYAPTAVLPDSDQPDDAEILLQILHRTLKQRRGLKNKLLTLGLKAFSSALHSELFLDLLLRTYSRG